jgi:hypothetical protein
MADDTRFHSQVLRGLSRALADENAHVRRYSRLATILSYAGAVLIVVPLFFNYSDLASAGYIGLSAVGGFLAGLSVFFSSSIRQWPVVRRFIDAQAVREAAARLDER